MLQVSFVQKKKQKKTCIIVHSSYGPLAYLFDIFIFARNQNIGKTWTDFSAFDICPSLDEMK